MTGSVLERRSESKDGAVITVDRVINTIMLSNSHMTASLLRVSSRRSFDLRCA